MQVVLVEPEIPPNTGNISRTCASTGTTLHLVRPLGFSIDDKHLRRAGLDYWHLLDLRVHDDWAACERALAGARMFFFSTKAPRSYAQARYGPDDCLVFGRETKGLPEALLRERYDDCVRIPILADARSLNLSNSVAIGLFEALRQQGFPGLARAGDLPNAP